MIWYITNYTNSDANKHTRRNGHRSIGTDSAILFHKTRKQESLRSDTGNLLVQWDDIQLQSHSLAVNGDTLLTHYRASSIWLYYMVVAYRNLQGACFKASRQQNCRNRWGIPNVCLQKRGNNNSTEESKEVALQIDICYCTWNGQSWRSIANEE